VVEMSFSVSIGKKLSSSSIWVEGVGSGAVSNTAVVLNYYPYYLYDDGLRRPIYIVIIKDNIELTEDDKVLKGKNLTINETFVNSLRTQEQAVIGDYKNTLLSIPLEDEGKYIIAAFDADNDIIYTYTFAIEGTKSKSGMVVGMVLGGVMLIMIFVFIRIRSKMKVK
jgi:hypothetical protein